MIDPGTAILGSAAVNIFGNLLFGGGDSEAQMAEINRAIAQFEGIVPPDLAKSIVYTAYQQGGSLTPQQLSSLPIEAQEVIQLQERPEMRRRQEAQLSALESLARTGMGPQERLAMEESRLRAAQEAQSRQQGLLQKYQEMGRLGDTGSLMAQLQGQQQSSQDEMLGNMRAAAMAAENRRAAIQQAMAGADRMRQQDLGVDQSNIEARRQRQEFDVRNAIARQQYNAEAARRANEMNLQRQQAIMDMNIKQQNEEAYRRGYLAPQQMYANQMDLARAKANAYLGKGEAEGRRAAAQAQSARDIIGGISQAGMIYGMYGAGGGSGSKVSGSQVPGVKVPGAGIIDPNV
jgi:hypothetical protein